jgi:wyosine [tRNA(Phe)-imidazoG37] synthetase (radical SAM superfamily)
MNYTFGPVISRRFGISLGIDLSPVQKICNFDCLYCELTKAKPTQEYNNDNINIDTLIKEVENKLIESPNCDVITLTANGEPTLYPRLEEIVDRLNIIKGDKKILILSNSSTIMSNKIQKILNKIDIVKLSLDTVDESIFRKIDRSVKDIKIDDIINGILEFKKEFKNSLIIEVLIVKGINDKRINELSEVLSKISPHRIDLSTIDRPPAFDVKPIDFESMENIAHMISINNQHVNIASRKKVKTTKVLLSKEEIINTLSKRPFTQDDIDLLLDDTSIQNLNELIEYKVVLKENISGVSFFKIS